MIQSKYKISIITTCLNEVDCINDFYNRIVNVLKKFSSKYDYEIIVVDNKSSDGTIKILKNLAVKDKKFKAINFKMTFIFKYTISGIILRYSTGLFGKISI